MLKPESQSGFTLIEAIIYIGLFIILIGGVLVATYQMIEATDKAQYRSLTHNEAQFVIRKFHSLLNGASSVSVAGDTLTVHYPSGPDQTMSLVGTKVQVNGEDILGEISPVFKIPNPGADPEKELFFPTTGSRPVEVGMNFEIKNNYYAETFAVKKLLR